MNPEKAKEYRIEPQIELEQEPVIIPVIEEFAFVDKRVVEAGGVRISKRVNEREELIDLPLFREDVNVERVPRDKYVDAVPAIRHEGDVMIVSLVREELVIQKRMVLFEEIRISKKVVETHQPQSVTLRKEEVEVTRIAEKENFSG